MKYTLKNGNILEIREPKKEDALDLINLIKKVDGETMFLGREVGEFNCTIEKEEQVIESNTNKESGTWFVAIIDGKLVGQCSIGLVRNNLRFKHRATVAFMIEQAYTKMGIGGKFMETSINWCKEHKVEQIELDVVCENTHAIKMYSSFGFEIIGTLPNAIKYKNGTYSDEYLMIKKLV